MKIISLLQRSSLLLLLIASHLTAREPIAVPPAVSTALKNTTKVMDKLEQAVRNGTFTLTLDQELVDTIFDLVEDYSRDMQQKGAASLAKTFNAFNKTVHLNNTLEEEEISSLLETFGKKVNLFRRQWMPTLLQALAQLERDIKSERALNNQASYNSANNYTNVQTSTQASPNGYAGQAIKPAMTNKPTQQAPTMANKPASQQIIKPSTQPQTSINKSAIQASKPTNIQAPTKISPYTYANTYEQDDGYAQEYEYERSLPNPQKNKLIPLIALAQQLLQLLRPALAPVLTQLLAPQ